MDVSGSQCEKKGAEVSCDSSASAAPHHTPRKRRKRKHSGEGDHAKHHHGGKHGHRPPTKRFKHSFAMSSTKIANNIMKFRLGGSVSDPLNLEGDVSSKLGDDCSTCAPSPAGPEVFGQPSPLPLHLQHDPLNLEGKSEDFPANKTNKHTHHGLHHHNKHGKPGHKKKHNRRRTISNSKTEDHEKQEVGGVTSTDKTTSVTKPPPNFNSKKAKFRYGNYDRYYGYRNSGTGEEDVRLSMLKGEWFTGKDCLDIGSNTGQVTVSIARKFSPRKIVGIDIDHKLVKMAWKNLHRDFFPALAPDGRPFPLSLTQSRDPVTFPLPQLTHCTTEGEQRKEEGGTKGQTEGKFPHNVNFIHGNYVPISDLALDHTEPEYDVILALSLTKWIHLNWGDEGIKRFFRKVYLHLRPGGVFIVEPQPFTSYGKKKNVSAEVYKNYQQIKFQPDQFHNYLMSSEVGFTNHRFIGIPQNKSKGFRRPLHMYFKTESVGVASHALPTPDSGGSSPCEETRKLKSVVQVVGMEEPKRAEVKEMGPEAGGAPMEAMETMGGDSGGDGVKGESGEP